MPHPIPVQSLPKPDHLQVNVWYTSGIQVPDSIEYLYVSQSGRFYTGPVATVREAFERGASLGWSWRSGSYIVRCRPATAINAVTCPECDSETVVGRCVAQCGERHG
jgi:hypothetical protein